ncbi:MAG: hypothetical protein FJW86_08780 [Actinobacteria bacterium]|nr:hypothetical protein [Actinomycetota bacterium]
MGLVMIAVLDVAAVGFVMFVVLSQPRPVWRDAAEHSRQFWMLWAVASVVAGLAPAVGGLMSDWAAAIWLTVCCAFAALQPAMWADVVDVRRDIELRRRVLIEKRKRAGRRTQQMRRRWRRS